MKLTKEQFCSAVDAYQKMNDEELIISNSLGITEWLPQNWLDNYYSLLTELCEFKDEDYDNCYGTDLDYYCFELDFGRNWSPGMVTIDGKDIPLRNAEDLWNYINNI